jgi:prevent-host-death family protein
MRKINIHEAKTHLSRLVEEAAAGDGFIIAKAGRPIAKVVPLDDKAKTASQRFDFMRGQIKVPDDFDTMFADEIQAMFEGRE